MNNNLNILLVSFSDNRGGASIATRMHSYLIRQLKGVYLEHVVAEKNEKDDFTSGPSAIQFYGHYFLRLISYSMTKIIFKKSNLKHSLNIFSSSFIKNKIFSANGKYHIIHFHWVNNDSISIESLGKIFVKNKHVKVVFTLHDEWLFAGTEHCIFSKRYIDGYISLKNERSLFDLDKWTFERKKKAFSFSDNNTIFTCPSLYLLNKAKSSDLLAPFNVVYVPNCIDTSVFVPGDQVSQRQSLNLPVDKTIITFGAVGCLNFLKGGDLLEGALKRLKKSHPQLHNKIAFVSFGGNKGHTLMHGFLIFQFGHIYCKSQLAKLYSSSDFTVVPSRSESFGQVAAESLSCETPVVAFKETGISDIVIDGNSGILVDDFCDEKLSDAIYRMCCTSKRDLLNMGRNGRLYIRDQFSSSVVSDKWEKLYKQLTVR